MKEKNRIDDFFSQSLNDVSVPEGEWNTPDDAIWAQAKLEINKKKGNKKLAFLLFFIGCGGMLLSYVLFNVLSLENEQSVPNDSNKIHSGVIAIPKNIADSCIENIAVSANVNKITKVTHEEQNSIVSLQNVEKIGQNNSNKPNDFAGGNTLGSQILLGSNAPSNKSDSTSIVKNSPANHGKGLGIEVLSFLPRLMIVPIFNQKTPILPLISTAEPSLVTEVGKKADWEWEVGISHARFPVNPFTKIEAEDLKRNKDLELLSSRYINFNFSLTKRLSKKWSLTSGFYYTQQQVNVGYQLEDIEYETNSADFGKNLLPSIGNKKGGPFVNDDDLKIIFLPGAGVNQGDLLNLEGQLPIQLDIYQIPFIFTYEIGSSRWRYLLNAGFSIDFLDITIEELPVKIYKGTTLVSTDINFRSFNRRIKKGSVYLGGGLKYFITDHLNLSTIFKLEPFGVEFSRYEMGLHWRF